MRNLPVRKLLIFILAGVLTAISLLYVLYIQGNEVRTLQKTLKPINNQLAIDGYIEQQSIRSSKQKDFYHKTRTLYSAVSNYYFNDEFNVGQFIAAKDKLVAAGWSKPHHVHVTFIDKPDINKAIEDDWNDKNIPDPGLCLTKPDDSSVEICLEYLKEPEDIAFLGSGNDTIWVGHNNDRKISKSYNIILSAKKTGE